MTLLTAGSLIFARAYGAPQGLFPAPSALGSVETKVPTSSARTSTSAAVVTAGGPGSTTSFHSFPSIVASKPTATSPEFSRSPADTSLANNEVAIQKLVLTVKAADRIEAIQKDASFKFDFDEPPEKTKTLGLGGHTVRADRESFPPLIGTGLSMTLGFLGPCGFNTPHTHPRSSEINVVVQGTLQTEFILENGARTVKNTLEKHQMTVFPQGALHTEFNPNCDDAIFVAGFASEDPGVQQAAQSFFGMDKDVVQAAIGNDFTFEGKDVGRFRGLIPENVAMGVESCLAKCKKAKA